MGLFSSKKKTTVGTSIARVIEEDLPGSIKVGMLKGIMRGGDLPAYVMEELIAGPGIKVERMFEYAKNTYTYGLPSGTVYSATQGAAQVRAVIEAIEGTVVLPEYVRYGPINSMHMAWVSLIGSHGYNPETNELTYLSAAKGVPVYLKQIELVVPLSDFATREPASLDQWGTPSTAGYTPERAAQTAAAALLRTQPKVVADAAATHDYVKVTGVWVNPVLVPKPLTPFLEEMFTIPITGYDETADYFHAKYRVNGVTKYWTYLVGQGTYPTLDAVFNQPPDVSGTYFPFAYFRFNKTSMANLVGTPEYTTSKKLVKYLGIDYAAMIDAIHENPGIGDVEQAMLMMAVPANTTDAGEARYLFDYFSEQYAIQGGSSQSSYAGSLVEALLGKTQHLTEQTTTIRDARFTMALSHTGLFKRLLPGKIGKVGTYAAGYRATAENVTYTVEATGQTDTISLPGDTHYYRRQVSASILEEVSVHNLKTMYYVAGSYKTIGDDEDKILLVPLDRSITRTYSISDRERLYNRGMHFVFNSLVVTKVKWYQSGWFSKVLIVIAIIVTIYTYGATWEALAAAVAAGTVTIGAFLYMVAIEAISYIIAQYAIQLFIEAVGVEAAFLIALTAAMYGGYQALDAGSIAGAPWAKSLLQMSSSISSNINAVLQNDFADLLGQQSEFEAEVEKQTKLLDTAKELLDGNNLLSPFTIFGENPDDFFNRTVHSGNIGAVGISAVTHYVDVALTLPSLPETLGGPLNGLA